LFGTAVPANQNGGRSAENYMRLLSNSIDEISAVLVIDYEAKPGGDMNANLDRELTAIYKPANTAARSLNCTTASPPARPPIS